VNGKTGEPVPVWGTVLGVAFALVVGVGGVLVALDAEEEFRAEDAVVPGIVGVVVGLALAGVGLWLTFVKRWPADSRTRFLSVPAAAGLGILSLSAPPAAIVGVSTAASVLLLPLMIIGGAVSRRRGTSFMPREPDDPDES
jgi:hypothetical protein